MWQDRGAEWPLRPEPQEDAHPSPWFRFRTTRAASLENLSGQSQTRGRTEFHSRHGLACTGILRF